MRYLRPLLFLAVLQFQFLPCASHASPPAPPALLPAFPLIVGDNVMLAWSPVPGAASYKVYRDGAFLVNIVAPAYTGGLPASAKTVRFEVSALSDSGEEGRPSVPCIVQLQKIARPVGIRNSVNPDLPSVSIAWGAVNGAFSYNVYRAEGDGDPVLVHSGADVYFRDRSVGIGARYGYSVSGIDRYGREGERSEPHVVDVYAPRPRRGERKVATGGAGATSDAAATGAKAPSPFDGTFREVLSIRHINNVPLGDVSFLGPGDDNVFWVVRPRAREIDAIDRSGKLVRSLGPAELDAAGNGFVPHKVAAGADGRLVVSDVVHGAVACFGLNGGLRWSRKVVTPPDTEREIWEGFPPGALGLSATPSSVLVLPGEILVTDQRLQLIYRLSHEGALLGYVTHYRKGEYAWRLRRVGELEAVPGKGLLVTFPLVRKALLVDAGFAVISEISGSAKERAAGFLGLHGVRFVPGEGVLITDPITGRLVMYDPATGEHVRTLKVPPLLNPNMAAWERSERIWVYLAMERRIAVLAREAAGK